MHGWMGKILHVNLNNLEITHLSTQPYIEKYLGGRGIASRIYWETVAPEIKAFDPENRLIFMTGPLVATGTQAATGLSVVGKSPMALPEGYCYGNVGGFIGPELKKAGFDGVVVHGRALKPVYLWIHDNEAELRDASSLWGQGVYRVGELLRQTHGEKVRFITTGLAGERGVRTAVGIASHESSLSAGFGAVMGSKNFKALVVMGSGKPSVADSGKLKDLNRYTIHIGKRLRLSIPQVMRESGHTDLFEVIGRGNCYQCGMECLRNLYRYTDGRVGYRKCQSHEVYLPWKYSQNESVAETVFDAPVLCNDYSICTFELRNMLDWLYTCYQSGSLNEHETGLQLSRFGTREFLEQLLHSIACREGFGDILAEGLARIGERVSDKARDMLSPTIAAIGCYDDYPARAFTTHALIYPMEPRAYHPLLHEIAFTWAAWKLNLASSDKSPITSEVFIEVARTFWGSEEAGYLSTYEGKALAAKLIQDRTYVKDSLGLCDFGWPILYSFNTPDHVGDPRLQGEIFSAVTGIESSVLDLYGERICNLQRAILVREGRSTPQADYPPDFNFTEPLGPDYFGRKIVVPGPNDEVVDMTGNTLDRGKFINMLKEYYRIRKWDQESGLPYTETLAALDLDDLESSFRH